MTTLKKLLCLSLVACSFCFVLTGCGNKKTNSTSGNNDNNVVNDAANNVGNAAEDLTNGVGNAVEDLVGANGFNNYEDAHKYFLETMGNYHSDAKFEIRDENRNLTDYQEGSKGYHFKLYDTSKKQEGELFGEFYVDADTGVIYQANGENNFVEYRGTNTDNNATGNTNKGTNTNGTNNNGTGTSSTTTNGTDGNNTSTNGTTSNTTTNNTGNTTK